MTNERTTQTGTTAQMDHLVRALSHDMNANFMVLENSVAQLKRSCGGDLSRKLTSGFDHVEACLKESKRFLDDLVMLGKTGVIQMEPASVDLSEVLAEVKYEQEALLAKRGIEVCITANLPSVWCNRSRAKQVFTNLIRNAARHGCAAERPRITVSCDCAEDEWQDDEFVQVCVHDNGSGIDPAYQSEVFLPGRRAPGGAEDGTGMGLAIVKKIVEYYGGGVWIDPACTVGTAVVVSLPNASQRPAPSASGANDGKKTGVPHDVHDSSIRGPHRTKRISKRRKSVK